MTSPTFLFLCSTLVAAPGVIPVQGYLTTSAGVPVDGDVTITFRLYADSGAVTPFYEDALAVEAVAGRFATRLGGGADTLELGEFVLHPAALLTFQIAGDTESARVPLGSVPYAASAQDAAALEGASLADILEQIPSAVDLENAARAACFDTSEELHAALDASYLPASYQPSWLDIQDRPAGLDDGDDTPTQIEIESLAAGVCYDTADELRAELDTAYLAASYQPTWSSIQNRPTGLDNGDDNTIYQVGLGLTMTGTNIALSQFSGGSLIPNGGFESGDLTGWTVSSGAGSVVVDSIPPGIGRAFRNTAGSTAVTIASSTRIPVRRGETYRISGKVRRVDTSAANNLGSVSIGVRFFGNAGNDLPLEGLGAGYLAIDGVEMPSTDNTWHGFYADFGAAGRPIPLMVGSISIIAILNQSWAGTANRVYEVTDLQIRMTSRGTPVWRGAVLTSMWVEYGSGYSPAGYRVDSAGIVHLRGLLTGGLPSTTTPVFTLEEGFRPAYRVVHGCHSAVNSECRVDVEADGDVLIVNGAPGWVSLDGITFPAEQ